MFFFCRVCLCGSVRIFPLVFVYFCSGIGHCLKIVGAGVFEVNGGVYVHVCVGSWNTLMVWKTVLNATKTGHWFSRWNDLETCTWHGHRIPIYMWAWFDNGYISGGCMNWTHLKKINQVRLTRAHDALIGRDVKRKKIVRLMGVQ